MTDHERENPEQSPGQDGPRDHDEDRGAIAPPPPTASDDADPEAPTGVEDPETVPPPPDHLLSPSPPPADEGEAHPVGFEEGDDAGLDQPLAPGDPAPAAVPRAPREEEDPSAPHPPEPAGAEKAEPISGGTEAAPGKTETAAETAAPKVGEEQDEEPEAGEGIDGEEDDRSGSPSASFWNEDIQAKLLVQVGQIFGNDDQTRMPHLVQVDRTTLERVERLYVPPTSLGPGKMEGQIKGGARTFLVHGPHQGGKRSVALHLANLLRQRFDQPPVRLVRQPLEGFVPFHYFVASRSFRSKTIYVVEESFRGDPRDGVDPEEVEAASSRELQALLEKRESWLILCSEQVPDAIREAGVPLLAVTSHDRKQILERHLEEYTSGPDKLFADMQGVDRLLEHWDALAHLLTNPGQIDAFCRRVSELPPEADRQAILACAARASRRGQDDLRRRFLILDANQRLYAMLLSLFQGLPRYRVEEIYVDAATHLRQQGIQGLADPRESGLDELMSAAGAAEQETTSGDGGETAGGDRGVFFADRAAGEEALRQVDNHLHLLHSLGDVLERLIIRYAAKEHWRFRRSLAEALGRVGGWRFSEVWVRVNRLAAQDQDGARVVVGSIMGQAFSCDPDAYSQGKGRLREWIESGDPQKMFVAGASLWRVYESVGRGAGPEQDRRVRKIRQGLLEILDELVTRSRDSGTLSCAVHALHQIARIDPAGAVERLKSWDRDLADPRRHAPRVDPARLGKLQAVLVGTVTRIFEHGSRDVLPPIGHVDFLLELVSLVLSSPRLQPGPIEPMVRCLAHWSREARRREKVAAQLVLHFDRPPRPDRRSGGLLRIALSREWLSHEVEEVRRLGLALVTHSLAVVGFPCDLPGGRRGLVLVDTSREGLGNGAATVASNLVKVLRAAVDVELLHLGRCDPPMVGDDPLDPQWLQRTRPRPPLVMPLLDDRKPEDVSFVLVLSWQPVVDLEEARSSPWRDHLVVIQPRRDDETAADPLAEGLEHGLLTLPSQGKLDDATLAWLDVVLHVRRVDLMSRLEPARWHDHVARALAVDPGDAAALDRVLRDRIRSLDEPGTLADSTASRWILGTVLWRALERPGEVFSLLDRWLDDPSERVKVMGEAGVCMLFRLFATSGEVPAPSTHNRLLELAARLAPTSWNSVVLALAALNRWLEEESWKKWFRGPGRETVADWIRNAASAHGGAMRELVQELGSLEQFGLAGTTEERPSEVRELTDRILLQAALAGNVPLPELEEGSAYGVLVLGSGQKHPESLRRLRGLALRLLERAGNRLTGVTWLIFRCGRSQLLLVDDPGEPQERVESLSPDVLAEPWPQLLNPLVLTLHPDRVRFLLLLQTGPILDADDLAGGRWDGRILAYSAVRETIAAGPLVPLESPHLSRRDDSLTEEADHLLHHLARRTEVRP